MPLFRRLLMGIMKNLCTNWLLGGDFQSQHKRVVFQYNGSRADLFAPKINHVNVMSELGIKPASLFNNLLVIAVRWRQSQDASMLQTQSSLMQR